MRPFVYERASNPGEAARFAESVAAAEHARVEYLAGGTTLVDLMKLDVLQPNVVIDINALQSAYGGIESDRRGLRLGALARMADVADHPQVNQISGHRAVAAARGKPANPQHGKPRRQPAAADTLQLFPRRQLCPCNKRNPGAGCAAMHGFNRSHAVLGTSDRCIATYPGDFAQALLALDATVELVGRSGSRTMAFSSLHRRPGDTPYTEINLRPDELIAAFRGTGSPIFAFGTGAAAFAISNLQPRFKRGHLLQGAP